MLIPTRWLCDEVWTCVDSIIKEPFIRISKNLNQVNDVAFQQTAFIPKHYNNIQEVQDPLKRQGKGRPAGKRIKAYNEKGHSSKIQRSNVYEEGIENSVTND
ncbi:3631_t:CDS:2 [Scutellospora calospora]|uniref:3631_t:CDS:1 n=1 Tax=Scutellospora calospora TaxID=85575 RepID=A0ACA9KJW3_9GLOM|nr:3631_t:CDS:2 [Scutellospora calospora]